MRTMTEVTKKAKYKSHKVSYVAVRLGLNDKQTIEEVKRQHKLKQIDTEKVCEQIFVKLGW